MSAEQRWSVACQAVTNAKGEHVAGGCGGWYGEPDDRCPKCGRRVVVTDTFMEVSL